MPVGGGDPTTRAVSAALLAGVVAGYGVAVPVGAIAVLVVSLSARTSWRIGAAAALGVASADGLYALLAVVGGTALAGLIAPVAEPMRLLAAVLLLAMAGHTGYSAVRRHRQGVHPDARRQAGTTATKAYGGLLLLTLLNPMTVVYFAALVIGRQSAGRPDLAAGALFVLGVFLASASWQLLLAGGGSLVGRALTGARGRLLTAVGSSALIVALAVVLLLSE